MRMESRHTIVIVAAGMMLVIGAQHQAGPRAAAAQAPQETIEARQLVDRGRLTLERFAADPELSGEFRDLAGRARGVLIAPAVVRGEFAFEAAGGDALFVTRGARPGEWHGPAFYTVADVSLGAQLGGDASEVVLLAMTDRGAAALVSNNVKLGAGIGVAAGQARGRASAATASLGADLVSYSRAKGLYAGVSLDGAVVATRHGWNRAFYGKDVTPADILVKGDAMNILASGLFEALNKMATAK